MKGRISLQLPSVQFKDSYIQNLKEFQWEYPERGISWRWLEDFDQYLAYCKSERERTEIVGDLVPQTTYWIILDNEIAVGKFTIRYQLTEKLKWLGGHFGYEVRKSYRKKGIAKEAMRLGLEIFKESGIKTGIVTCDDDNLGSIRVLEGNGGVLESTYERKNWVKPIRKYVFSISE